MKKVIILIFLLTSFSLLVADLTDGLIAEYQFNGKLDELCLYNRALSDSEIEQLYHKGELNAPQNIEITLNNNIVNINWDEVSGATYNVYRSFNPNIPLAEWTLRDSEITNTS